MARFILAYATALLATVTLAAPMTVFEDGGFGGDNTNLAADVHVCYTLTNGWGNKISSVKIDDGFICHFFPSDNCDEPNGYDTYHGDNPTINAGMNDRYNSYQCFLDLKPIDGNGQVVCNNGAHDGLC